MPGPRDTVSIRGTVGYETGVDAGGGSIVSGHCLRKYDGIHTTADSLVLRARPGKSGRDLTVEINEPLLLPDLIVGLALEPSEEENETSAEFGHRLSFRDELATAFEEAAAKLRRAPRT